MVEEKKHPHFLGDDRHWKLFADSVADYAIFFLDREGRVASWNSGAERTTGYAAEEVIGRSFALFYVSEDQQTALPEQALIIAEREGRVELEGWRQHKDGSRFWAINTIVSIRNDNKELLGFAKIARDITERVMTRRALEESERKFRLFVQSLTDYAIYMLDAEGYITNWNTGAQNIFGYLEDEAIGRHFSCFYTGEDIAQNIPQQILNIAEAEKKYVSERFQVCKDGRYIQAHIVIEPVYDIDGSLIGYAKITRDITERVKTENDLQQTRQALFHARKMEAIGQLTGGIAHDFNNLLTVVVNSLEILSSKDLSDREKRLLANARQAASRGARLTHQLLAFARRQTLGPDVHDLNLLIGAFDSVLRGATGAYVKTTFDLGEDLYLTKVDSAQFEAALLNLVVNARDAMPEGGEVILTTANIMVEEDKAARIGTIKPGRYVAVTVTDHGHGIPPDLQARLFEPFFTTKEVGKGTGLGLSQVYNFVTQSGGGIEVISSSATGTSIRIYLPATEEAINQAPQNDSSNTKFLKKLKVLVVEDEQDVRDSTVAILEDIGCRVFISENTTQALGIIRSNLKIDIMLSDVVLRDGVDGIELARMVRREYPNTGIILTSGHPGALVPEQDLIDRVEYLPKPYDSQDIKRCLSALKTKLSQKGNTLKS